MTRFFFILIFGFILGALVIENKTLYTDKIIQPVAFLPDGGEYDGKLRRGELDGLGLIIWPFGDRYEGEFKAGLYHGNGRLETAEFIYEGDFFEGIATGEAKIIFTDGRVYEGEVEAAKANGLGVMTTANVTYRGGFKNNQYHGEGLLIEKSGRRYEGFFESGVFWGYGKLVDDDGSVFQGLFANGLPNGKGLFRGDSVSYEGGFKNGLFHGVGIYRDLNSEYEGEFANGEFHGSGRYLNNNGLLYEGEFQNGQFSGKGVLNEHGTRYEGEFFSGLKEGEGTLIFAELIDGQESLTGTWRKGALVASDQPDLEFDQQKIVEQRLYDQQERMRQALLKVVDQDPSKIDVYFFGIVGDGRQDIFRRDAELVRTLFDEKYQTRQRSLLLVNGRFKGRDEPLATKSSIAESLQDIATKMDAEQDILFLLLSGTASKNNTFYLEQPGIDLEDMTGEELGVLLKSLPVKNKVIIVSSCFSGGFVKLFKNDNTTIIVSSAADKEAFECGGYRQNTRFIKTFFEQHFNEFNDFGQAFEATRNDLAEIEKQLGYIASDPLIFRPKAMIDKISIWREQWLSNQPVSAIE